MEAFTKNTATPDDLSSGESELELSIGWYNAEMGEPYDDLEHGAFFMVEGCWQKTPAAVALGDKLKPASWCEYG